MAIPENWITESQLRLFNGDDDERMYVAYKGIIYDVTDCPRWRRGIHEGLHLPGQVLSWLPDHRKIGTNPIDSGS